MIENSPQSDHEIGRVLDVIIRGAALHQPHIEGKTTKSDDGSGWVVRRGSSAALRKVTCSHDS